MYIKVKQKKKLSLFRRGTLQLKTFRKKKCFFFRPELSNWDLDNRFEFPGFTFLDLEKFKKFGSFADYLWFLSLERHESYVLSYGGLDLYLEVILEPGNFSLFFVLFCFSKTKD